MTVTHFAAGAIAAVVGWVTVVVREAASFNAFLTNRAVVVGGAVGHTDAFAVGVKRGPGRILAVFISGTIAVI